MPIVLMAPRALLIALWGLALPAPLLAREGVVRGGARYPLTAPSILRQVAGRGEVAVVTELFGDEKAWDLVTTHVSTGGRQWLLVAQRLLPYAGEDASSDLEAALGTALVRAPESVLAMSDEKGEVAFALSSVCGETPVFERDPSIESLIETIDARRKAVARVSNPRLQRKRNLCLESLERARSGLVRELEASTKKIG